MAVSNKVTSRKTLYYLLLITMFMSYFVDCEQTVELPEPTLTAASYYNGTVDDVSTISSTTMASMSQSTRVNNAECSLSAVDPLIRNTVLQLLKDKVSLIEYRLSFLNYTFNPLTTNVSWLYSGDKWSRVTTSHGQVQYQCIYYSKSPAAITSATPFVFLTKVIQRKV